MPIVDNVLSDVLNDAQTGTVLTGAVVERAPSTKRQSGISESFALELRPRAAHAPEYTSKSETRI